MSDLEIGLLSRVRHWTDLFGWIRLANVLRLAASPPSLLIVAVTYVLWRVGMHFSGTMPIPSSPTFNGTATAITNLGTISNPSAIWTLIDRNSPSMVLPAVVWSLLLWTPVTLMLARQGGLLTAGRSLENPAAVFKRSLRRSPSAWLVSITPSLCAAVFGVVVFASASVMRLASGILWLEIPMAATITLLSIPMGILLFGSFFATPLALSSIANEQQADPLDSLSRGYEALYRRPVHLLFYCAVAFAFTSLAWALAAGVMQMATASTVFFCQLAGTEPNQQQMVAYFISRIPIIVSLTTLFGMLGGVYLLARQSTGEQEVEDLWIAETTPIPPMPVPNA